MDAGTMQAERNVGGANGHGGIWSFYQYMTSPMNVRYIYAVVFFLANVLAWAVRENPQVFFRGQRFGACEDDHDCLTVEAVLIVSCTCCLFFFFMSISTMYTSSVHDRRNSWQTQWWLPKIMLAASFLMISILAPSGLIQLYGKVAHLGAGVFLFIQLISVIRYITRLNSRWCQASIENHYLEVNTVSILAYSASIMGVALMFKYTGCYVNIVLISSTLLLVYLMPLISRLSMARGYYMEPGLMGVYIVFLCWSAIKSEPDTSCNKKGKADSSENWKIISFVVELINIVVATFSTGTDYKCIQFKNVVESENDIPYGYGFLHFVFAIGSMYFGMLFLGWDTHHASEKWNMDVSWTSKWIHIANEGLAVIFFVTIVLARIYGTSWLRQFIGHMFGIGGQQHGDQSHATETDTAQPPSLLPPTTEQHGDQSHATETETGRPPSSLPPTTTELHIDLSSINDTRPAPQTSVLFEIEEI